MSFESIVETYRDVVDDALRDSLIDRSGDVPSRLGEAMAYSVLAGGKRLRPVLCLLACEAVGGDRACALPAATALELIHTYSLIHDDLPAMDDDDLRRGRATCHKQFDDATAILAGDGLLTHAFEVLAKSGQEHGLNENQIVESVGALANAAGPAGMVGGQMADLQSETLTDVSVETLIRIHARKTGRLIAAAVQLGGIAGGASAKKVSQLVQYGEKIGLAFQIADDVLDEIGDAETIGKSVRKDADRGKATYPTLLGLANSQSRARELVDQAIDALSDFGDAAEPLRVVANYIIDRDR